MFFSIVKIAIVCLVIISFLYIIYKATGKTKTGTARDKLENAEEFYEEAVDYLTEAEKEALAEKERAEKELAENERLRKEVEDTKKDIIH